MLFLRREQRNCAATPQSKIECNTEGKSRTKLSLLAIAKSPDPSTKSKAAVSCVYCVRCSPGRSHAQSLFGVFR